MGMGGMAMHGTGAHVTGANGTDRQSVQSINLFKATSSVISNMVIILLFIRINIKCRQ
jgi:hypothetical protein